MNLDYPGKNGSIKAGFLKRTLWDGFNGIADLKTGEEYQTSMKFKSKGGNIKLFKILNNKQFSDAKKIKYCDYVIVNEKNLKILKNKLLDILIKI